MYISRLTILFFLLLLQACTGIQIHSSVQQHNYSLTTGDLEKYGLAVLTPSTPTGYEEDTQLIALSFTDALVHLKPDIQITPLPDTLAEINQNDYINEYQKMYYEYNLTGVFKREYLQEISELLDTRYLVQLKLGFFEQGSNTRFGLLGYRFVDTHSSKIRFFMQIWDAKYGSIAWEGLLEINYANDTVKQRTITFITILNETVTGLINKLP